MKTINLYFDFEFTSLSPEAQPISLGIVSDTFWNSKLREEDDEPFSKSFYSEFSDFDINRCDDWVKENVVSKLQFYPKVGIRNEGNNWTVGGDLETIQSEMKAWLDQFSDYKIQFIGDCCTWDWYWMVQLLDEREKKPLTLAVDESMFSSVEIDEMIKTWREQPTIILKEQPGIKMLNTIQLGLPKLPENISPVPFDLNDLIAIKKGITPKEAFELDREELTVSRCLLIDEKAHKREVINKMIERYQSDGTFDADKAQELKSETYQKLKEKYKHNSLFDAKVIKEIYQKLK